MVYINENSTIVNYPKISDDKWDKIHFENQTTHFTFDLVIAESNESNLVYKIDMTSIIELFEAGQYDYSFMTNDGIVVSSGIIQFEGFEPNTTQYENRVEYIQYTPED